jgi:hypothetical protein
VLAYLFPSLGLQLPIRCGGSHCFSRALLAKGIERRHHQDTGASDDPGVTGSDLLSHGDESPTLDWKSGTATLGLSWPPYSVPSMTLSRICASGLCWCEKRSWGLRFVRCQCLTDLPAYGCHVGFLWGDDGCQGLSRRAAEGD